MSAVVAGAVALAARDTPRAVAEAPESGASEPAPAASPPPELEARLRDFFEPYPADEGALAYEDLDPAEQAAPTVQPSGLEFCVEAATHAVMAEQPALRSGDPDNNPPRGDSHCIALVLVRAGNELLQAIGAYRAVLDRERQRAQHDHPF